MPILRITLSPLPLMLDPEARAILAALHRQGHTDIEQLTCLRVLELRCQTQLPDPQVQALCEGLLTNPAIESYSFEWVP